MLHFESDSCRSLRFVILLMVRANTYVSQCWGFLSLRFWLWHSFVIVLPFFMLQLLRQNKHIKMPIMRLDPQIYSIYYIYISIYVIILFSVLSSSDSTWVTATNDWNITHNDRQLNNKKKIICMHFVWVLFITVYCYLSPPLSQSVVVPIPDGHSPLPSSVDQTKFIAISLQWPQIEINYLVSSSKLAFLLLL